mgnify:CR=1 FL=1
MPQINAYLTFDGNCHQAMEFYRDALGGTLNLQTIGESPMAAQMPTANHGLVMHAHLAAEGFALMASDMSPDEGVKPGNNIALMLYCGSEAEIRQYFAKLSAGARSTKPLKEEFWGSVYGEVEDQFGLRWMLNWDKPKA